MENTYVNQKELDLAEEIVDQGERFTERSFVPRSTIHHLINDMGHKLPI